jgi:hypothetical protein
MTSPTSLIIAVEDESSGAVTARLLSFSGGALQPAYFARGFGALKESDGQVPRGQQIPPHIAPTDLDRYPCPSALLDNWGATLLPANFLFRIAVREVEAWPMADNLHFITFINTRWDIDEARQGAPS